MKTVGVTGGIGTGKTLVCSIFETMGIPVFNSDVEALKLYETDAEVIREVARIFGDDIFHNGVIDRKELGAIVFNDEMSLAILNQIIHPKVAEKYELWLHHQDAPYIIKESAILINSKSYLGCDYIILVTSDEFTQIERVKKRSGLSETEIRLRIGQQMKVEEQRKFCHFEIVNDGTQMILPQITKIHRSIMA